MARRTTQLDEWLAAQDEERGDDGASLGRVLTAVVLVWAVIYLGGHVIAALVR